MELGCPAFAGQAVVEEGRNGDNGVLQREASVDRSTTLSLSNIRQTLIRQEDTIIYSIIERAQVCSFPSPGLAILLHVVNSSNLTPRGQVFAHAMVSSSCICAYLQVPCCIFA